MVENPAGFCMSPRTAATSVRSLCPRAPTHPRGSMSSPQRSRSTLVGWPHPSLRGRRHRSCAPSYAEKGRASSIGTVPSPGRSPSTARYATGGCASFWPTQPPSSISPHAPDAGVFLTRSKQPPNAQQVGRPSRRPTPPGRARRRRACAARNRSASPGSPGPPRPGCRHRH